MPKDTWYYPYSAIFDGRKNIDRFGAKLVIHQNIPFQ